MEKANGNTVLDKVYLNKLKFSKPLTKIFEAEGWKTLQDIKECTYDQLKNAGIENELMFELFTLLLNEVDFQLQLITEASSKEL